MDGQEYKDLNEQVTEETIRDGIEKKQPTNFLKELYEWSQSIALAVVLALIINQFLFALVQVEGS